LARERADEVDHLALAVSDQQRSRRFYERYLGFVAEPTTRSDGVLMLHNATGFSLALGETEVQIRVPSFLHFGAGLPNAEEVRAFRDRLVSDGVEIACFWDEPDYVSVKFRDPDRYVVEVSWEPSAERSS
jgi:catechol 2,3-dioxygenase-like lactoylglutathione lyase family enzyme